MMTREMVMELLATAGEDLMVSEYDDEISVTVYNFEGFDEDWSEIIRELDDEVLVDTIYGILSIKARRVEGDFYRYFHFDGFTVCWGYASFDI